MLLQTHGELSFRILEFRKVAADDGFKKFTEVSHIRKSEAIADFFHAHAGVHGIPLGFQRDSLAD